jgi:hypothetical protein
MTVEWHSPKTLLAKIIVGTIKVQYLPFFDEGSKNRLGRANLQFLQLLLCDFPLPVEDSDTS